MSEAPLRPSRCNYTRIPHWDVPSAGAAARNRGRGAAVANPVMTRATARNSIIGFEVRFQARADAPASAAGRRGGAAVRAQLGSMLANNAPETRAAAPERPAASGIAEQKRASTAWRRRSRRHVGRRAPLARRGSTQRPCQLVGCHERAGAGSAGDRRDPVEVDAGKRATAGPQCPARRTQAARASSPAGRCMRPACFGVFASHGRLRPNTAIVAISAMKPSASGRAKNMLMNNASGQAQKKAEPMMILMPVVPCTRSSDFISPSHVCRIIYSSRTAPSRLAKAVHCS